MPLLQLVAWTSTRLLSEDLSEAVFVTMSAEPLILGLSLACSEVGVLEIVDVDVRPPVVAGGHRHGAVEEYIPGTLLGCPLAGTPLMLPDPLLLLEGTCAGECSEGDPLLGCSLAHCLELVGDDPLEVDLTGGDRVLRAQLAEVWVPHIGYPTCHQRATRWEEGLRLRTV